MPAPDIARILQFEHLVWEALVAGDGQADAALLDDAFLGVYETGFSDKAGHVSQLDQGATVSRYSITEARLLVPSDDLAILCYRAEYERVGASAPEAMYVSSIWQHGARGWRNIFSQDTAVGDQAPV